MEDFLTEFNKKKSSTAEESNKVVRPFVCEPHLLPLAERQELKYKYQYLEESVEALALFYRLHPKSLKTWIEKNKIERITLETDEEIQAFESDVNQIYKSLQVRILGLTALNTAKAWHSLAVSEDNLLASLVNATEAISQQDRPDAKVINSLAATHEKLTLRHELITKSMETAGDVVATLKDQLGWEIEITHVDNKSKNKKEDTTEDDSES